MAEPAAIPTWLPARLQPLRALGAGGFGEVWLALDQETRREVAVKRMLARSAQDAELAESERLRFKREYATLSRLQHPGIVRMLGSGEANGDPWFMMEFVAGLPLQEYLQSGRWQKPAAPGKILDYFKTEPGLAELWRRVAELFEILSYLHDQGLVHRDLKPDNLIVGDDGRLKLIDFGLTRAIQGDDQVTLGGSILGTVSFMSPEQIRNQGLDGRSDLYAAGAMLYLLATGVVPFDGPVHTVVMKHLSERPPAPRELNPLLAEAAENFILKLLAKEPGARYRDAGACLLALQMFSGAKAAAAQPHPAAAPGALFAAPFIGNEAALAALQARCLALQSGRGAALRIRAAAGAGKSRLGEEAAGQLAGQGIFTLDGRSGGTAGGEADGALFSAIFTALADRAAANPQALEWPRREFAILSTLYAPLSRVANLPPVQPLEGSAGRRRLIAAAVGALRAIARQRPLLLRLDEIQPADDFSLEIAALLAEFLEGSEPLPLLMLLMSREGMPPAPGADSPRQRVAAAAEAITLAPLSRDESGRLLAAWLGQEAEPPADFVEELWTASAGNPGLLAAALRGLIGDGHLKQNAAGAWLFANAAMDAELPENSAAAAGAQLAALPPPLHSALRMAAFIGGEFHFNWWMEIAACDDDELHAHAGEAIRLGLLADAGRGRLRFVNEEICALLEMETPGTRRERLHARVLAVLEAGAPDPDRELPLKVFHALGGGEAEPALRHGHRLGRRYLDNGQAAVAAPLLEKLRALLDSAAAGSAPAARRLTQLVLEAALFAIGNAHSRTASLCRDGLGLARQLRRPVEERELQRRLSYALNGLGAYPSARAAAERALKLAEEAGDERDQVRAMLQRAIALRSLRDVAGANACLEEAGLRAAAAHDDAVGGVIATEQGIVRWEAGELAGAARAFDKARRLAEKAGNDLVLAAALGNGAEIALETGRLAEGEAALQRALEINRTLGVRTLLADNLNNLGLVRHLRGDPAGAREYLDEALKLARALEDPFLEAFARLRLAAVALVCGDDDEAAAGALLARQLFAAADYAPGEARARLIEAEIALRAGNYAEACFATESALEKIGAVGSAPLTAQALAARALAIRLQGRALDPGLIAEAERQAEISGHLLARLLVSLRHARLLLCDRNPAAARPLLERARADARAAGFHWQVKEAEELLKSIA